MLGSYTVSLGTFSIGIDYDYYDEEKELYVKSKYDNLKAEVLNYKYINLKHYLQEINPKVDAYFGTKLFKSLQHKHNDEATSKSRLMCIILYTDYSELSSHFSSTFRKSNTFEPTQAMIRRHRNYYWMARLLRDAIQVYGKSYNYGRLRGPFYCGMSTVMNLPSFAVKLLCPTSTSCHIEVAIKFSGESGCIIQSQKYILAKSLEC